MIVTKRVLWKPSDFKAQMAVERCLEVSEHQDPMNSLLGLKMRLDRDSVSDETFLRAMSVVRVRLGQHMAMLDFLDRALQHSFVTQIQYEEIRSESDDSRAYTTQSTRNDVTA